MDTNILECSSKGDKRFSALFAKVVVNGVLDSIENHYQKAKVFKNDKGEFYTVHDWKEAKGKKAIAFKISNYYLPLRFGLQFYDLLWYKYLKTNPILEKVLENYNDYNDIFAHGCICSQANSIREYMQDSNGVKYPENKRGVVLFNKCIELTKFLNRQTSYIIEEDDIFNGFANIIGHQVNAQGKMASGIAKIIREDYKLAYNEYMKLFETDKDDESKMGKCQIVNCCNKYIANLFGQKYYGRNPKVTYTNYDKLEEALLKLKDFAKGNNLIVSLPYNIGCGLANGDWDNEVLPRINKIFKDYYVLLYKKD